MKIIRILKSLFTGEKYRKCKNCGQSIRGLEGAKEIPVHVHDGSRHCDGPNVHTKAEW